MTRVRYSDWRWWFQLLHWSSDPKEAQDRNRLEPECPENRSKLRGSEIEKSSLPRRICTSSLLSKSKESKEILNKKWLLIYFFHLKETLSKTWIEIFYVLILVHNRVKKNTFFCLPKKNTYLRTFFEEESIQKLNELKNISFYSFIYFCFIFITCGKRFPGKRAWAITLSIYK